MLRCHRLCADPQPRQQERTLGDLLDRTQKFPKHVRFTFSSRIDNMALDIYEGWPHLYQKVEFDVNWSNGQTERAFYYVMGDAEEWAPTIGYVECVLEGYEEWKLDEDALFAAWQRAEDADDLFFDEALPSNYLEWNEEDQWVYNDLTGAWRQVDSRKAREGWEVADSTTPWEDKPFKGYYESSYDWQKWIDEGLDTAEELDYDPTMKSV